ncbi:putative NAD(P)H-hydrate epimerase [Seiridium cardinale]|uniref:NAD(P)H-hydrate epimerase n=1 Tax=Seiridium cardinale TaxID=138064 RepID=A0ABR2XAP5_9PEZI
MALKTLGAKAAAALDKELMSTGAFSIDQLMELAGLSVSQVVYRVHPLNQGSRILVACGPGNNGGDGLVAARHLKQYGYQPTIYYPKRSKNELYQSLRADMCHEHISARRGDPGYLYLFTTAPMDQLSFADFIRFRPKHAPTPPVHRLAKQLEDLEVPFVEDFPSAVQSTDHVVDAIFGFSFSGEVREPFPAVIKALEETKLPVTSVDAPSSWNIEDGPPASGLGSSFMPEFLISLTAPKPLVKHFKGRHFVGGRFVSPSIAKKYDFEVPEYQGLDQIVEVSTTGQKL